MTRTRMRAYAAGAAALLTTTSLAACGGTSSDGDGDGEAAGYVSGGSYVAAISSDPGHLIPMTGVSLAARAMVAYAYESLAAVTKDGEFKPWLAASWEETGTSVSYTLKEGITCADGTPFTAQAAADNINYHADPEHATFYYGSQVNEEVTATADGDTLTVARSRNDPLLLANTATVEMVCPSGLADPDSLQDATAGTGLFQLDSATPGSTYTYTRRTDYTWGPDGVTSTTEGLPDTVEVRVVTDETTAANLLVAKDINAAVITGASRDRLDAMELATITQRNPVGEMLFNEKADRVTADPLVRRALVLALDRAAVGDVVSNGTAIDSRSLIVTAPFVCVAGGPKWQLPDTDLAEAERLLDQAGWTAGADGRRTKDGAPLTVKFIYDAATATHAPAAELVQQTWDQLGITTELSGNNAAAWSEQLFQTFDWDTGFVQVAPGSPPVLASFFAAATPDQGGNNFMFVDNPAYEALIAQAAEATPEATCDLWQQAEAELVDRTDVFPLADNELTTYLSGAELTADVFHSPAEIRMLG
ncbi:ABC transporter substrate-binding protein [Solwaraspora sp. WMMB335]|uniref:ABC transporter substrate-binding protein n=1 Tax=Solwaraspora sp. WMMB335 TaxID=3404118 RepID=UPI003B92C012